MARPPHQAERWPGPGKAGCFSRSLGRAARGAAPAWCYGLLVLLLSYTRRRWYARAGMKRIVLPAGAAASAAPPSPQRRDRARHPGSQIVRLPSHRFTRCRRRYRRGQRHSTMVATHHRAGAAFLRARFFSSACSLPLFRQFFAARPRLARLKFWRRPVLARAGLGSPHLGSPQVGRGQSCLVSAFEAARLGLASPPWTFPSVRLKPLASLVSWLRPAVVFSFLGASFAWGCGLFVCFWAASVLVGLVPVRVSIFVGPHRSGHGSLPGPLDQVELLCAAAA